MNEQCPTACRYQGAPTFTKVEDCECMAGDTSSISATLFKTSSEYFSFACFMACFKYMIL